MTKTSRRTLLGAGILGSLLAAVSPVGQAFAATTTDLYSRSRFKRQLNARFTLSNATSSWSATLVGVSDLPGAPRGADNAFGLTFQSATGGPAQGTYTLRRSGFTATTLFVVPSDAERHYLQVVVNRAS